MAKAAGLVMNKNRVRQGAQRIVKSKFAMGTNIGPPLAHPNEICVIQRQSGFPEFSGEPGHDISFICLKGNRAAPILGGWFPGLP
jgi:hypothetical protein